MVVLQEPVVVQEKGNDQADTLILNLLRRAGDPLALDAARMHY
jgi:hypothetical protein